MFVSMALFLISCATAGATFGVALCQHGHELTTRSREVNILAPDRIAFLKTEVYHTDSTMKVLGLQAWNSLLGFHRGRDTQPQYGIKWPLTDSYTAALMIPGLLLAVLRLSQFVATNALVWTAGYLLFGLTLQFAPGHNRATGALPLGMVLAAIALVQCCRTAWPGRRPVARVLVGLTIAAAVAFCVAEGTPSARTV